MAEPQNDPVQTVERIDQVFAGVLLAASFVLVSQLVSRSALDAQLNTALNCFALSIPLLTLYVVDCKVKKSAKLSRGLLIARTIIMILILNAGMVLTFIGLAATFFHYSRSIGLMFIIGAISAYFLWGADYILLGFYTRHLLKAANLRRWQESGQPQLWVESHQGQWEPAYLLSLFVTLRESEFWPMALGAVVRLLGKLSTEWWNLRRWQESGQARDWMEAHQNHWNHDDWLALLGTLQKSEFWPMDPKAVSKVLETLKRG